MSRWAPFTLGGPTASKVYNSPRGKKTRKAWVTDGYSMIFTRNGSKWIQMNTRCWNTSGSCITSSQTRQWIIRSIPIHAEIHGSMMIQVIYDQLSPGQPGCGWEELEPRRPVAWRQRSSNLSDLAKTLQPRRASETEWFTRDRKEVLNKNT